MATIVCFVQVRNRCQCGVYTVGGTNDSMAKNKKRKEPYIATLFERYCMENPFIYMSWATLKKIATQ